MSISKTFKILFAIMFLLNVIDIHSTYYFTPTLQYESNPIVNKLGLTWFNLYLVLFFFLAFNVSLVYYHTDIFKHPAYSQINSKSFRKILQHYFLGNAQKKGIMPAMLSILKSVANFSGLYVFWQYSTGKLLAIFYNYSMGFVIKQSQIVGMNNGLLDVKVDANNHMWKTTFGSLFFKYSLLRAEQRILIDNVIMNIISIIVSLLFLYTIYKRAAKQTFRSKQMQYEKK